MKVAFSHPDLGIGGAERLVVDCALALQNSGHEVTIFTSHHDPKHAFDETKNGTLKVKVSGNSLVPRHIAGKLSILCATLRQSHLVSSSISNKQYADFDIFFIDQLSAAVPYLRAYFTNARILFYCHHPDSLLTSRDSIMKKLYRLPFDSFEKWSTSKSDQIAVNSEYTRKVFFETFGRTGVPDPAVLYPVVDAKQQPLHPRLDADETEKSMAAKLAPYLGESDRIALSINRFEVKKSIDLAIAAFSLLLHAHPQSRKQLLIIAGGYDERVLENIEYLQDLEKLAKKFRIPYATKFPSDSWEDLDFEKTRISFLPSVSSNLKNYSLANSASLLYTPTNEHFGIVPIEAMSAETPVLATNTGGPLETVQDGVSGWLREPDMEAWYHVLRQASMQMTREELLQMGKAGRENVLQKFSMETMQPHLNSLISKTKDTERKNENSVTLNTRLITSSIMVGGVIASISLYCSVRFLSFIGPIMMDSLQW